MKNILLLVVLVITFSACKKEDRIEKNLWKGDGGWKIEQLFASETSSNNSSSDYNFAAVNAGTFTFKKDGSGQLLLTIDGEAEIAFFNYIVSETTLTLIYDGEPVLFQMDWKKNGMTITNKEVYSYDSTTYTYTEKYVLKKK